jgi:glycosyltransferase involved in cell wall biosynthesis
VRIAIDATPVLAHRKGIGVVLDGLISTTPKDSPLASALIFVDERFISEARSVWPDRELEPVRMGSSLLWELVELPRLVRNRGIDLLLTTRDRTLVSAPARTMVWLFEIPDHRVQLLRRSQAPLHRKIIARLSLFRFRRIVRSVSHFVVSSEFTRNDLAVRYVVPVDRITMIAPGVSDTYRNAEGVSAARYVLHFATGDLRDNSEVALGAFAKASRSIASNVRLVLAGVPDALRETLEQSARARGIGDRIDIRGYVPAAQMPQLFAGAEVYFDPTLFEGFGLQLLEAMSAGTPVVTSNYSSAQEVVGDAGITASSDDEHAFAAALTALINDAGLRSRYSSLGKARAAAYTWGSAHAAFNDTLNAMT